MILIRLFSYFFISIIFLSFLLESGCTSNTDQAPDTIYTCSMHPKVRKDGPGNCPICGMPLIPLNVHKERTLDADSHQDSLILLMQEEMKEEEAFAYRSFVRASVPLTTMHRWSMQLIDQEFWGSIEADERYEQRIITRTSGRIDSLFIKTNYSPVKEGAPLMKIYSEEIVSAQERLLYLLKSDPTNQPFIDAAVQTLRLLGMQEKQLRHIMTTQKPDLHLVIYSPMKGIVYDGTSDVLSRFTIGDYVKKDEALWTVYDPYHLRATINIYEENLGYVKEGQVLDLYIDGQEKSLLARVDRILPYMNATEKTITLRAYIKSSSRLNIGMRLRAMLHHKIPEGYYLPKNAVLDLGTRKVVFKKQASFLVAQEVRIAMANDDEVQILSGLISTDSVALDVRYLVDGDSFIDP